MSKENTLQELKKGVEILEKNIDGFGYGSCERIVLSVLKHKEVQDAFVKLVSEGYDFYNYDCRDIGFIPGKTFLDVDHQGFALYILVLRFIMTFLKIRS
jgi:hypothetical protein